jgi:hypothetical protein
MEKSVTANINRRVVTTSVERRAVVARDGLREIKVMNGKPGTANIRQQREVSREQ